MHSTSATGDGRGFTLVEMMVVLTIMALLAASVPLALNRFMPTRRITATADHLIAEVERLQSEAASSGRPARLVVTEFALPTSTTLRFRAREDDRPLRELVLYPDGTASGGRFMIADSGREAVVEIGMLTGRARRTR
ncbi:MAG TPA: prepilin-type N-terminal cleavage/methylation domain-containing protein [Steroidobacteraceae bacterium]|jgi:prepilin-type N-terminal cleavage/methylation domain-containing protein